jgi:hypothetical protein
MASTAETRKHRPAQYNRVFGESELVYVGYVLMEDGKTWEKGLIAKKDIEEGTCIGRYEGTEQKGENPDADNRYLFEVMPTSRRRRRKMVINGDPTLHPNNLVGYANYADSAAANAEFEDKFWAEDLPPDVTSNVLLYATELIAEGVEVRVDYDRRNRKKRPYRKQLKSQDGVAEEYLMSDMYKKVRWAPPSPVGEYTVVTEVIHPPRPRPPGPSTPESSSSISRQSGFRGSLRGGCPPVPSTFESSSSFSGSRGSSGIKVSLRGGCPPVPSTFESSSSFSGSRGCSGIPGTIPSPVHEPQGVDRLYNELFGEVLRATTELQEHCLTPSRGREPHVKANDLRNMRILTAVLRLHLDEVGEPSQSLLPFTGGKTFMEILTEEVPEEQVPHPVISSVSPAEIALYTERMTELVLHSPTVASRGILAENWLSICDAKWFEERRVYTDRDNLTLSSLTEQRVYTVTHIIFSLFRWGLSPLGQHPSNITKLRTQVCPYLVEVWTRITGVNISNADTNTPIRKEYFNREITVEISICLLILEKVGITCEQGRRIIELQRALLETKLQASKTFTSSRNHTRPYARIHGKTQQNGRTRKDERIFRDHHTHFLLFLFVFLYKHRIPN